MLIRFNELFLTIHMVHFDPYFQDLAARQKTIQTDFIKNQNHVASAQKAAEDAKKQASKANTELYKLNIGFKNVSVSLESKTESIGSAKDRAVDLQQRANALATSASNQLSNLLGVFTIIPF